MSSFFSGTSVFIEVMTSFSIAKSFSLESRILVSVGLFISLLLALSFKQVLL